MCISGQILQGLKKPHDCPAFGKDCTPENPLGATMVSSEGACAAYYHYGRYLAVAATAGQRVMPDSSRTTPMPERHRSSLSSSCPAAQSHYEHILLGHGSGGQLTADLIQRLFVPGVWQRRARARSKIRPPSR